MNEFGINGRGASAQDLRGATDEATDPAQAAAVLTAAGLLALTTKVVNRWTLAGTSALVALGMATVLVRRWRGPLQAGG